MGVNILAAHGGGPTAVINTSLQGVIEGARESGRVGRIYAARFGAEGILNDDLIDLTDVPQSTISKLAHTPASAIGSCRRKLTDADCPTIVETMRRHDIGIFLYNGGNDSMDTCDKVAKLARAEGLDVRVIGIPKTMDNDLAVTDNCPGFGSAARYAAISACETALDASALPIHVVVLELMGRNAGWVTAAASLAARATDCEVLTYLPELLIDEQKMLAQIENAWALGRGVLVAVSEGIRGKDGRVLASSGIVDGFGHTIPGGTGQYLSNMILEKLGIKSRAEKPGLLSRASIACVSRFDQREAYAVGRRAVYAALEGESDKMIAIRVDRGADPSFETFLTPLDAVANVEKRFPIEWIVDGCRIDDRFFDYASPLMDDPSPDYAILR